MDPIKPDTPVSIRIPRCLLDVIDSSRRQFRVPRTSWILQAIIFQLEYLGYKVDLEKEEVVKKAS